MKEKEKIYPSIEHQLMNDGSKKKSPFDRHIVVINS